MDAVPDLDRGLNLLETPVNRTTALHQIGLAHLRERGGSGFWIDARENASPFQLRREGHPVPDILLCRAFTAFQHYEIVRTLPRHLPDDLELVIAPCLPSLYCDTDVPDWEGEWHLESALAVLDEIARIWDVPVLVSSTTNSPMIDQVRDAATKTITYERTGLGYRFEADDFETTVYWQDGYWQTTIQYWVELFGAVDESDPAVAIDEAGLMPGTV